MNAILNNHMTKQALVGAGVGAVGGLLFGSMPWVIGLTILGGVLGVVIDLIDKAFYRPESQGGGQHTVAMLALVVFVIVSLVTGILIWVATL